MSSKTRKVARWDPNADNGMGGEYHVEMTDLELLASPGQSKYEVILAAIARIQLKLPDEESVEKLTTMLIEKTLKENKI